MKKVLFLLFISFLLSVPVLAQKSSVSFAGGAFVATNDSTTFVGFMGPKVSVEFPVKNLKLEIGLTGVPGLTVRPEMKLGLSAGVTVTLKKENWKLKPVFGVMLVKTKTWQVMPGIGFLF